MPLPNLKRRVEALDKSLPPDPEKVHADDTADLLRFGYAAELLELLRGRDDDRLGELLDRLHKRRDLDGWKAPWYTEGREPPFYRSGIPPDVEASEFMASLRKMIRRGTPQPDAFPLEELPRLREWWAANKERLRASSGGSWAVEVAGQRVFLSGIQAALDRPEDTWAEAQLCYLRRLIELPPAD